MTLRVHPDEIVSQSKSPLLRVHESWERVRLDQVCEVKNGGAFPSALFNTEGHGIPLIRIRDVGQPESKTFYSGEYRDDFLVVPGDLVVGMDGDFRVARWPSQIALLNQRVCRLRVRSTAFYNQRFLYYVLQGYLDAVQAATSAVTVKHLSSKTIKQLPLPLPPLKLQKRIVECIEGLFSSLDGIDSTLTSLLNKLDVLRSAILADVFYTYQELPSDWEMTTLGRVCEINPRFNKATIPDETLISFIPMAAVEEETGKIREPESRPMKELRTKSYRGFQEGDVLVAKITPSMENGKVAVAKDLCNGYGMGSTEFHVLRPCQGVEPSYVAWFVLQKSFRAEAQMNMTGTAGQLRVPADFLSMAPIPMAPPKQQRRVTKRIVTAVSRIQMMERSIQGELKRVKALRQTVLGQAFTGRLVPQNPNDEPSSALLRSIAGSRPAKAVRKTVTA